MKCSVCGSTDNEFFPSDKYRCKPCNNERHKKKIANRSVFERRRRTIRARCHARNIFFDLSAAHLEDIWTGQCPVFKTELAVDEAHVDRIEPTLGYVDGNVAWLSPRANRIKSDATIEELQSIIDWIRGL